MNKRLFSALSQQLKYEVFFVTNVSDPYYDAPNNLKIVDFEYKGQPFHLVLNGTIELQTNQGSKEVKSYQDLIKGLVHSAP